ncbi:MAG: hypothetical protein K0R90_342 [Oscillospiraceae bacterium]|nr:hypothetical protein [Oscillospiraceae bacterium]
MTQSKKTDLVTSQKLLSFKKQDRLPFEKIVQNLPGAIKSCLFDQELSISYLSKNFLSLCGYSEDELKQLFDNKFLRLIHPDDYFLVMNQLESHVNDLNEFSVEYRVVCKDKSVIWLLDCCKIVSEADNLRYIYAVAIDITERKESEIEQNLCYQKYKVISEQLNGVIFEYSFLENKISFSTKFSEVFGFEPCCTNFPEYITQREKIEAKDLHIFANLCESIISGEEYSEAEFRALNAQNKYIWCLVQVTTILDENGIPLRAIGRITDIDKKKREVLNLKTLSRRDSLTGIYNKMTAQAIIEKHLEASECESRHAMFIIDIDNFKMVNDSLGHMFGDAVLISISSRIREVFGKDDVIGRVGGDEFVIFSKNIESEEQVCCKAKKICDIFNSTFVEEHIGYEISGSIGISFYPQDGRSYFDLFKRADVALYHAKKSGKNCYVIYENNSAYKKCLETTDSNLEFLSNGVRIAQDASFNDKLFKYTFDLLYERTKIEEIIMFLLKASGEYYGVSRAYVYEQFSKEGDTSKTYEWCHEDINPVTQSLEKVSCQKLKEYFECYNSDGVLYCNDVTTLPEKIASILAKNNVKAILNCKIQHIGESVAFIGFDDCNSNRLWTKNEIETLTFISKIVKIFLLDNKNLILED